MRKTFGISRNLAYRYNQLISEESDRRKSNEDSKGEILDKRTGSK